MIAKDFLQYIFPHFRQFKNIHDIISEMELRERAGVYDNPHYLTVLYFLVSNMKNAHERMTNVLHESGLNLSQKEFARELAIRLGLNVEKTC